MNKSKKYHWGILVGAVIAFFSLTSVNASGSTDSVTSQFWVLLGTLLALSAVYTWGIGLTPPLLIRFLIMRRPMGKGWAIGTAVGFFFINTILFIILNKVIADAVGSQPRIINPIATIAIAFVSYFILRKKAKNVAIDNVQANKNAYQLRVKGTSRNYIRKHWRGELSLAISFWVNFFLINTINTFLINWFAQSSPISHPVISARVAIIIVIINWFIYVWQIVGLWRSCNRHVAANGRAFWARTAQTIVVLCFLATLGYTISYWGIYKEYYQIGFQKDTTPAYSLTLRDNDSLIHLKGGLRFGVSKDVAALLKDHPEVKGIILDCVGGKTYEGRELSKLILIYGLDTYTLKGCYSAGTMAFVSGTNRFLGTGANLGFHQYRVGYKNLGEFVDMEKEQEEDLRIFKRKGIKKEFLEKLYDTSSEDLWYPSIDELLGAGVIHGVVNTSDLTPVEYKESIEDINVKEILLDIPVFKTIQKYEPEVFEQIITDMSEQLKKGATFLEMQSQVANNIRVLANRMISKSSDEALIKYIQAWLNIVRKFVEKDPFICLKYLYPQQYGTFRVTEYLSNEEMEPMNDALHSIIIDAYEKETPPVDIETAELQRQKVMLQLGDDAAYFDIGLKELQNSDQYKRHCDALISFYELILAKDKKFAANVLRYMFAQVATDGSTPDGGKYDGDIVDGKKHGYGTYTWPDGEKYVGEWRDNGRNGQGALFLANGDKYVGEWENGEATGQGTYTYSNGEKYVGEWKDSNNAIGGWYYLTDGSRKWAYTDAQGNWRFQTEADSKINDGFDTMLAKVRDKKQQAELLEELRLKKKAEEKKRLAEIERLKREQKKKRKEAIKEDVRKYQEIVSSEYGRDMKVAAWDNLVNRHPEASGLAVGDINGFKRKLYPQIVLRSSHRKLSVSQVQSISNITIRSKVEDWGFYGYSTIDHDYNLKSINGDKVVIDHATGLMWHQNGSKENMKYNKVEKWLKKLNRSGYAGYHDWRLPTVEEASSLLESSKSNDLYIDPIFSDRQRWIWTGDKKSGGSEGAWRVALCDGYVLWGSIGYYCLCVRPVRSITGGEVTVATPEQDKTRADSGTASTADSNINQIPSSLDEPFIPPNEENMADFVVQLGLASSKLNETDEEQLTEAIGFLGFCIGSNLSEENEDEYEKMTDLDATAKLMVKLYRFAQKNGASMTLQKYIELADEFRKQKSDWWEQYQEFLQSIQAASDVEEALESYKQAIRIDPDNAEAHLRLGNAYNDSGKYNKEAIESYKQAISINPDYVEAHAILGAAYFDSGKYKEAIEACKQAIKIAPDYVKAHFVLGLAYVFSNDRDSAIEQYEILMGLNSELANKLFNFINK